MKRFIVLLLCFTTTTTSLSFGQARVRRRAIVAISQTEREEGERIRQRFKTHWPRMSGWTWSLIHSYASQAEMEQALRIFQAVSITAMSNNPASVRKFNGPRGFKEKLVVLMNSRDDTVSGFAASLLAVIGDLNYAPHIAALLERSASIDGRESTVRARAAMALGLLGAKQYAPRLAQMLKSDNDYDRSGAALGLGSLKATEYAGAIAALFTREWTGIADEAPIQALLEMGVGENFKKEIAQLIKDQRGSDTSISAAYALAHLQATDQAEPIAALLKQEYSRDHAAKALAILGARDYASQVALLLEDESSSTREAGAVALGILGAREYVPAIAKLLKDNEPWVRRGAALALVLLEANEYAGEALPIVALQTQGPYFNVGSFNGLVAKEVAELDARLKAMLDRMKRRHANANP